MTLRKRIAIHENLPVCVAVTIGRDFDETLGDAENENLFDQTLQEDVVGRWVCRTSLLSCYVINVEVLSLNLSSWPTVTARIQSSSHTKQWRHRTCDFILARMKRQQLVRGLVVWGAWACSRSLDRKLARASNCFSRLGAAFVKRAYQVWHEYVLCERSNARNANTIMDRVKSGRMITVLHAHARGAARAKSRGQALQGYVRQICALKHHENTRLKSTVIQLWRLFALRL